MAVKIDIPGVGEVTAENAASERTLREILKALGGKTPTGQTGSAGGGGPSKEASEASKKFASFINSSESLFLNLRLHFHFPPICGVPISGIKRNRILNLIKRGK